jgi:RimJ/RimL family protein N-acetyltransferase
MERVQFGAYNENKKSVAAMKSIGCVAEGVLRSTGISPDGKGRSDSIVLSILKNEWFGSVKANLESKIKF